MKHFNCKAISIALIITLGAMYSVNATAAQTTSLENSISEMIIAQGQQVLSDLTVQLQQSITAEINSFSIDFSLDESITESLAWLSEETETPTSEESKQDKQPEKNSTAKIKLLK